MGEEGVFLNGLTIIILFSGNSYTVFTSFCKSIQQDV